MPKLHWPEVDVQIESESQAQQDVTRVLVSWDSGIADRAQEDCIDVVPEMFERRLGERLLRAEVMIGAVGEPLEVEREPVLRGRPLEDRDRGFDDLGSYPVAGDDGDLVVVLHSKPVARPQLTQ